MSPGHPAAPVIAVARQKGGLKRAVEGWQDLAREILRGLDHGAA